MLPPSIRWHSSKNQYPLITSLTLTLDEDDQYWTPAKPEFLSVTIGFPPAQAQYLTQETLQEVVNLSIKQLEPEFVMTAEVEKVEGGIAIMAIIREHDPY